MEATYITSAQRVDQLPDWNLPEIAFLGRSNCGKSSLLNAILDRKNLARVSAQPGRTQMVNFFSLSPQKDKKLIFADLPGWGYNTAGKDVQKLWKSLLQQYLKRPEIRDLLVLIDVRREFVDFELEFLRDLCSHASVCCVLTKIDKLNRSELAKVEQSTTKLFADQRIPVSQILMVSSLTKKGVPELREFLFRHLTD